jgi:hypothetical protein
VPPYTYPLINDGADAVIFRVIRIADKLLADKQPEHASRVRRAIIDHRDELNVIAREIATKARQEIQDAEASSRVRPDTGGRGGPRLGDFIGVSHPIPRSLGSVGINDEDELDRNGVEWWKTNEYGYGGHIGRQFIGAFEGTRPDPNRSREHALLRVGKGPGTGKGTIKEPIPERRFVLSGGQRAEAEWHRRVRASRQRMVSRVEQAVIAARVSGQRRARGGGRRP